MKIAFWHYYTFRLHRGIETLILSLANELSAKGHDVSLVGAARAFEPLVKPSPCVKTFLYPAFRYLPYLAIMPFYTQHFLKNKYDHVIVFFADFGEGITDAAVSLFRTIPLSLYLCYPLSSVPHRYESFRRCGWGGKSKKIFADAEWIAKEAEVFFQRKVGVVPVGTNPEKFKPNADFREKMRNKFGYGPEQIVLLNVSSLERKKGTWRILESMGRLKNKCPQLRYFILGAGSERPVLERRAIELGIEKQVCFGGETSELEGYYNMADIFTMLPDAEGNSVACHEAMSSGLPVIASRTKGFQESVPSEAGRLLDVEDKNAIDGTVELLSGDANMRYQMGDRARRHIQTRLSWTASAEKLLEELHS